MITANNLFIQYGDRILLNHVNLVITPKDKVGLVGRNGAGKSTLLKIIAGEISPDEGSVSLPSSAQIGFLHQEMKLPEDNTVMKEAMKAFEENLILLNQLNVINKSLEERTDYESQEYSDLLVQLSELNERVSILGGNSMEGETEKVLKGLGFKASDFHRNVNEFSGGWKMRIELAKILLRNPDFLLLDEPTNHLDIESIIWLENFLKDYSGGVVIISHDKQFLNNVTKRTLEVELGKLYDYKASYSGYLNLRRERKELQSAAFKNQQKVIEQKERTINRFMAKATKTKMAQSMKKQLDKIERIEIEEEDNSALRLHFLPPPRSGQVVLNVSQLCKNYGSVNVLEKVDFKLDRGDRVAFVGQNGQGKTTLAKMLVKEIEPSSGTIEWGHNVEIGYYAQNQSDSMDPDATVLETLDGQAPPEMRTRVRSILGAFMFSGEDVDKKVMVLSGGEKARLALACMLLRPFNLLVLDEPTNHLDIPSKEILKQALLNYQGSLIVVSHDRDFLQGLTTRTLEFRDHKLHNYLGDVAFFLEKRAVDNMRAIERSSVVNKSKGIHTSLSREERIARDKNKKSLKRKVEKAEKQIEKLENLIDGFENQMADAAFYNDPQANTILTAYEASKKELHQALEEWEEALAALEEFEN